METKRHLIFDTRLGLFVTTPSSESARAGAEQMNRVAGYARFIAKTITELH
jgi:hypothetical protein